MFKKKKNEESQPPVQEVQQQSEGVGLQNIKSELQRIEDLALNIQDTYLFSSLLSFTAYYFYILGFYEQNEDEIISVKELLFFKYIDNIKEILVDFNEKTAQTSQIQELKATMSIINEKLYTAVKDIKEKEALDLKVNLKTLQDLIRSDF